MSEFRASVGRIVHYKSYGTPPDWAGKQKFPQECRAAIVTEVIDMDSVSLCVLNPTGIYLNQDIRLDDRENPAGGTWHWPERV